MVEIVIASEEGRATERMEQRNDLVPIFHPISSNVSAYTPKVNLPLPQLPPLKNVNVLVQDIHAARRRFSVLVTRASRASSIASAMAGRLSRPS